MVGWHKVLLILPLLFLATHAKRERRLRNKHLRAFLHPKSYFERYQPTHGLPTRYHDTNFDFPKLFQDDPNPNHNQDQKAFIDPYIRNPPLEANGPGHWDLVSQNSGVSAMHVNLLPSNQIIVYDTVIYRKSRLNLAPNQSCLPFVDQAKQQRQDCFAHSMLYDIQTNKVRPLKVESDPWCSSGGLSPDGTFVSAGGFLEGGKSVRHYNDCPKCDWRDKQDVLREPRWYATQTILPDGEFILVGGRLTFSYEFVPAEGQVTTKPYLFPFLYETGDLPAENNLYPFVHLSTDGNLFVFSNNRSLLLNPVTNKVVRTFPILPGGSRNYPASGMSALLPLKLNAPENQNDSAIPAEVIVCGGNTPNAFHLAEGKPKIFLPALRDCNRLKITDRFPKWDTEDMPSRRTMGDLLILPNGELLFINGAKRGTSAWWDADEPNFTPVLYSPEKPKGDRFRELKPSQIARMYHSSSALLPSGKIWVGGSNTHNTYVDTDRFPTETRVENFSPPYLNPALNRYRPKINEQISANKLRYGENFETVFRIPDNEIQMTNNDIEVTIYPPPFTTHGYSMSQRLVVLNIINLNVEEEAGVFKIESTAPPSGVIAPPGYYMLFVVYRGVPSEAMWVHLQ